MNNKKIGLGIVTCNREHFFKQCYESIPKENLHSFVIINDGDELTGKYNEGLFIKNKQKLNVGASKNVIMRHLLDEGCDYIFTLEDDIVLNDKNVLQQYIKASEATGIKHFNFGFSQRENLNDKFEPIYRKTIEYKDGTKIVLTKNILGAFTFYTRDALQTIGLHYCKFDEGHGDHLELTYRAAKHKFTSPFWWFADIYNSWNLISNLSNMTTDSVVRDAATFTQKFNRARANFKFLHGTDIFEVPELSEHEVLTILKEIKS